MFSRAPVVHKTENTITVSKMSLMIIAVLDDGATSTLLAPRAGSSLPRDHKLKWVNDGLVPRCAGAAAPQSRERWRRMFYVL